MDKHIEMLGKIKSRDIAEDMDGYYSNIGKGVPTDINWNFIATLLYAGSIYE